MSIYLIWPNLSLFDGAAAGGEGTAAAAKGGESVVYGKQAGTPAAQPQSAPAPAAEKPEQSQQATDEERRAKYREFTSGEFKDLYAEDIQHKIDRRFKSAKETEEHLEKLRGIADRLAERYGVDAADADALTAAIDADDSLWEEAAENAQMSVQSYKAMKKLERDNAALVAADKARKSEEVAKANLAKWGEEDAQLRKRIPGYDLRAECQNPQFVAMVHSFTDNGFDRPIERALKAIHMDEITTGAVQQAAAVTEQRVTANVRARGARPAEAGLGSQSGVVVKDDVSKLTKKDRAEIARRAMRGERITF